jgi:hypothetical protein
MPTHERLGSDDRENIQDRRKPSTQLDKHQAITVGEADVISHLAPQHNQLIFERGVLCLKPALRLERRDSIRSELI